MSKWSDWHPWNGGKQPVSDDTIVQVELMDSSKSRKEIALGGGLPANLLHWSTWSRAAGHVPTFGDIIAYRTLEEG